MEVFPLVTVKIISSTLLLVSPMYVCSQTHTPSYMTHDGCGFLLFNFKSCLTLFVSLFIKPCHYSKVNFVVMPICTAEETLPILWPSTKDSNCKVFLQKAKGSDLGNKSMLWWFTMAIKKKAFGYTAGTWHWNAYFWSPWKCDANFKLRTKSENLA